MCREITIDYEDRFWLFGNRYYYSSGGLHDIKFTSNKLTKILEFYTLLISEYTCENGYNNAIYDPVDDFKWEVYDSEECIYESLEEYLK